MKLLLKLDRRRFFPNEARETKERESLVERMFRRRRTDIHAGLAFAMCFVCLIPIYLSAKTHATAESQNEIPTTKQQITDKKFKILSQVCAIKNETEQSANGIEEIINTPVYDSNESYVEICRKLSK